MIITCNKLLEKTLCYYHSWIYPYIANNHLFCFCFTHIYVYTYHVYTYGCVCIHMYRCIYIYIYIYWIVSCLLYQKQCSISARKLTEQYNAKCESVKDYKCFFYQVLLLYKCFMSLLDNHLLNILLTDDCQVKIWISRYFID